MPNRTTTGVEGLGKRDANTEKNAIMEIVHSDWPDGLPLYEIHLMLMVAAAATH